MKIQGVSGERKERDVVDGTAGLSLGSQFAVLLRMQLAHFRSVWRRYIIVSSAMPLGITLLLRLRGPAPHSQAVQFVAGGVTLTVALSTLTFLAQRVAWMKSNKTFDYYNTLPLSTAVLLLAMLVSYFVFAIPGILAITVIGSLIFSLPLEPSIDILWAMATLFLTGVALAGIGALIGLRARNEQLAGAYANIAMMAVLLLSIIPFSDLPGLAQPALHLIPSTYLVDALKLTLPGVVRPWDLTVDVTATACFAVVMTVGSARTLRVR